MNRQPIESRMLHSFAYDAEREILELQFRKGGKVYRYQNVGAVAAKDFAEAPSKGRWYLQFIKGNYAYTRLEDRDDGAKTSDSTETSVRTPDCNRNSSNSPDKKDYSV